ncbi:hypothetical protein GQ607_000697, partial [Colletotrichum asianum]
LECLLLLLSLLFVSAVAFAVVVIVVVVVVVIVVVVAVAVRRAPPPLHMTVSSFTQGNPKQHVVPEQQGRANRDYARSSDNPHIKFR